MDAPEDDQNQELAEIEPPLRLESPSPASDGEQELWDALGDAVVLEHDTMERKDVSNLPAGCPDTPCHKNSYRALREARDEALKDPERKYSSFVTQLRMRTELARVGNGMKPRFYQQDCAEAFLLGLDTGLICPTGSGKTEAFVLPLLADPKKKSKIIVVSPLNALQIDQVRLQCRIYSIEDVTKRYNVRFV